MLDSILKVAGTFSSPTLTVTSRMRTTGVEVTMLPGMVEEVISATMARQALSATRRTLLKYTSMRM